MPARKPVTRRGPASAKAQAKTTSRVKTTSGRRPTTRGARSFKAPKFKVLARTISADGSAGRTGHHWAEVSFKATGTVIWGRGWVRVFLQDGSYSDHDFFRVTGARDDLQLQDGGVVFRLWWDGPSNIDRVRLWGHFMHKGQVDIGQLWP
jgi:hypothetical protein